MDDPDFLYGAVDIAAHPAPTRFASAIPHTLEELNGGAEPPAAYVRARICAGDSRMQQRLLVAMRSAAKAGPITAEHEEALVGQTGWCGTAEKCDWLASALGGSEPEAVRTVLARALGACTSERYRDVIEQPGIDDRWVVDWHFQAHFSSMDSQAALTPRLAEAARRLVSGNRGNPRAIGVVLGSVREPAALDLIRELQGLARDARARHLLAVSLADHPAAEARRMHAEACAHPEVSNDPFCSQQRREPAQPAQPAGPRNADDIAREPLDLDELKGSGRTAEVRAAIDRCIARADEPHVDTCLRNLTLLDRRAAVAAARRPELARLEWIRGGEMIRVLTQFPEGGSLERQLRAWGLVPGGKARVPADEVPDVPLSPTDYLLTNGRMHYFDAETGMFPNEHDALLQELAAMSPDLDDVLFEEVPPNDEEGPYLLRAYVAGKRYQIEARNLGDWYDIGAVVALLNSVSRDRSSAIRFAVLPTGDQMAYVIAGPAAGLRTARDAGLLAFGDPDSAHSIGKGFEEEVFRRLQNGEIDPP